MHRYYPRPTAWRADVGKEERGVKTFCEYYVQMEYIEHVPARPTEKYYMRGYGWFDTLDEAKEWIKSEPYGPVRQAWITRYDKTLTMVPYFKEPHNIEE